MSRVSRSKIRSEDKCRSKSQLRGTSGSSMSRNRMPDNKFAASMDELLRVCKPLSVHLVRLSDSELKRISEPTKKRRKMRWKHGSYTKGPRRKSSSKKSEKKDSSEDAPSINSDHSSSPSGREISRTNFEELSRSELIEGAKVDEPSPKKAEEAKRYRLSFLIAQLGEFSKDTLKGIENDQLTRGHMVKRKLSTEDETSLGKKPRDCDKKQKLNPAEDKTVGEDSEKSREKATSNEKSSGQSISQGECRFNKNTNRVERANGSPINNIVMCDMEDDSEEDDDEIIAVMSKKRRRSSNFRDGKYRESRKTPSTRSIGTPSDSDSDFERLFDRSERRRSLPSRNSSSRKTPSLRNTRSSYLTDRSSDEELVPRVPMTRSKSRMEMEKAAEKEEPKEMKRRKSYMRIRRISSGSSGSRNQEFELENQLVEDDGGENVDGRVVIEAEIDEDITRSLPSTKEAIVVLSRLEDLEKHPEVRRYFHRPEARSLSEADMSLESDESDIDSGSTCSVLTSRSVVPSETDGGLTSGFDSPLLATHEKLDLPVTAESQENPSQASTESEVDIVLTLDSAISQTTNESEIDLTLELEESASALSIVMEEGILTDVNENERSVNVSGSDSKRCNCEEHQREDLPVKCQNTSPEHRCERCKINFDSVELLREHKVRNSSCNPCCSACKAKFRSALEFDKHQATCSKKKKKPKKKNTAGEEKNEDDRSPAVTDDSSTAPDKKAKQPMPKRNRTKLRCRVDNLQCSVCSIEFRSRIALSEHLYKHSSAELKEAFRNARIKDDNQTDSASSGEDESEADVVRCQARVGSSKSSSETSLEASRAASCNRTNDKTLNVCPCHRDSDRLTLSDLHIETVLFCNCCRVLFRRRECHEIHYRSSPSCAVDRVRNRCAILFCVNCRLSLNTWKSMRDHLNVHVRENSERSVRFVCNICRVVFVGFGSLFYNHWHSHSKDPMFVASRYNFPRYSVQPMDETDTLPAGCNVTENYILVAEHVCSICKRPFSVRRDLENHQQNCSLKTTTTTMTTMTPTTTMTTTLTPTTTTTTTISPTVSNQPTVVKQRTTPKKPKKDRIVWTCDVCKLVFQNRIALNSHGMIKHGHRFTNVGGNASNPIQCNKCSAMLPTINALEEHWRTEPQHNSTLMVLPPGALVISAEPVFVTSSLDNSESSNSTTDRVIATEKTLSKDPLLITIQDEEVIGQSSTTLEPNEVESNEPMILPKKPSKDVSKLRQILENPGVDIRLSNLPRTQVSATVMMNQEKGMDVENTKSHEIWLPNDPSSSSFTIVPSDKNARTDKTAMEDPLASKEPDSSAEKSPKKMKKMKDKKNGCSKPPENETDPELPSWNSPEVIEIIDELINPTQVLKKDKTVDKTSTSKSPSPSKASKNSPTQVSESNPAKSSLQVQKKSMISFEETRWAWMNSASQNAPNTDKKKRGFLRVKNLSELQAVKTHVCSSCGSSFESEKLLGDHHRICADKKAQDPPGISGILVLTDPSKRPTYAPTSDGKLITIESSSVPQPVQNGFMVEMESPWLMHQNSQVQRNVQRPNTNSWIQNPTVNEIPHPPVNRFPNNSSVAQKTSENCNSVQYQALPPMVILAPSRPPPRPGFPGHRNASGNHPPASGYSSLPLTHQNNRACQYLCNICRSFKCDTIEALNSHVSKHYTGWHNPRPPQSSSQIVSTHPTFGQAPPPPPPHPPPPYRATKNPETCPIENSGFPLTWAVKDTPQGPVITTSRLNETSNHSSHQTQSQISIGHKNSLQVIYRCTICKSALYKNVISLKNHVLQIHGINDIRMQSLTNLNDSIVEKIYHCTACPSTTSLFDCEEKYRHHYSSVHTFQCPACGQVFPSLQTVGHHYEQCRNMAQTEFIK